MYTKIAVIAVLCSLFLIEGAASHQVNAQLRQGSSECVAKIGVVKQDVASLDAKVTAMRAVLDTILEKLAVKVAVEGEETTVAPDSESTTSGTRKRESAFEVVRKIEQGELNRLQSP